MTTSRVTSKPPSPSHLVTRSGVYYYRFAVPRDLQRHYQKRELNVSLKTSNREAALVLFSAMESKVQMQFAMVRAGHLQTLPAVLQPATVTKGSQPSGDQGSHQWSNPSPLPSSSRPATKNLSLSQLIKLFLNEKAGGWTDKTRDEFKATFDLFENYFGKSRDVTQITRQDCIKLREKLLAGHGSRWAKGTRAPKTVNKKLTLLGSVFRYGVITDVLTKNPCEGLNVKMTKAAAEERKIFTPQQLATVFHCLPAEGVERMIPMVALHSGLRIEEVCQLRKKDVEVEDGITFLNIQGSHLKTISSKRRVPAHSSTEKALQDILVRLSVDSDYIFSGLKVDKYGCRSSEFSKWFGRFLRKEANIQDTACTFHSFRHTFASGLKQHGVEHSVISELLGHSTKGTTARYSKGYALKQLKDAVDTLHFL